MEIRKGNAEMTRKAADLSGIIAKKGEAKSDNAYIGDKPKRTAKKPVKTNAQTGVQTDSRYKFEKPPRRSDSLNIRITPEERARIEAICERTGAPITQVLMWGLEALERELEGE